MGTDLSTFFQHHHVSLVRMLYRRTGRATRAEELAREACTRAAAAGSVERSRTQLFAIALNLVREDSRRPLHQGRSLELVRDESAPAPAGGPGGRQAAVFAALDTLGDRDREALLLQSEGFSYDEIAETLGLARGAVSTALARARRQLVEASGGRERGQHVAS